MNITLHDPFTKYSNSIVFGLNSFLTALSSAASAILPSYSFPLASPSAANSSVFSLLNLESSNCGGGAEEVTNKSLPELRRVQQI